MKNYRKCSCNNPENVLNSCAEIFSEIRSEQFYFSFQKSKARSLLLF